MISSIVTGSNFIGNSIFLCCIMIYFFKSFIHNALFLYYFCHMGSIRERNIEEEIEFNAVPGGGPGGQHANRASTKVELRLNIHESKILTEEEKRKLMEGLPNQINKSGELIVTSQESRSQSFNRAKALEKFYYILEGALKSEKKRKKTKPLAEAREKRLEEKKKQSEKKQWRKPPEI